MRDYDIWCFLSIKSTRNNLFVEFPLLKCCTIKFTYMISWWLNDVICKNACMKTRATMM